jgi:predicted MFS family arabinose efflux permease
LFAFGVLLAGFAPAVWTLFLAQGCIGFAWGICYPVVIAMSFSRVAEVQRNTAMGVFQTGCSLGVFAGSWVSGLLASLLGIRAMFGMTAFALLVLALYLSRRSVD